MSITATSSTPCLCIIVAMTKQGIIGHENKLPWHLPADLKHFKDITLGHPIIMGRKTFESIGKVLPGRTNIVVSSNKELKLPDGVHLCHSLKAAVDLATKHCVSLNSEIYIIGGAKLFEEGLGLAKKLYVTWIEKDFTGDVYFPDFAISSYKVLSNETFTEPFGYSFVTYEKLPQDQ